MTMTETVLRTDRDGVAELRLHRPEVRNALSTGLLVELRDQLRSVHDDPAVRVVLVSGSGEVFCAGADVREFGPNPPAEASLARIGLVVEVLRRLRELPQPTLAAVHGPAVGAGWGLALACDLCFATTSARFALPEVAKGYRLPAPLVTRLAQVVGPARRPRLRRNDLPGRRRTGRRLRDQGAVRPGGTPRRRVGVLYGAGRTTAPVGGHRDATTPETGRDRPVPPI